MKKDGVEEEKKLCLDYSIQLGIKNGLVWGTAIVISVINAMADIILRGIAPIEGN